MCVCLCVCVCVLTLAEEHVPDAQHTGPGQRAGEDAHEPLCHVEDGVDLELLQVAICHGTHAPQQGEEDLPVQLDGFLMDRWRETDRERERNEQARERYQLEHM